MCTLADMKYARRLMFGRLLWISPCPTIGVPLLPGDDDVGVDLQLCADDRLRPEQL